MRLFKRPTALAGIAGLVVFVIFVIWYRGGQAPLSGEEQAYYLAKIEQFTGVAKDFVDMEATRELMRTDDGKPFYVLNVFKFRDQADYGDGASDGLSGVDTFKKFRAAVLPIWIKNGAHPVFTTTLSDGFVNEWDMVSVVRYRSRRDYAEIQTSSDFLAILPHRIASAETNIRIKLPGIQIPPPLMLMVFVWLLMLAMGFLVGRIVFAWKSRPDLQQPGHV
ncbi:hypothetical protein [Halopseudomonas salegens]|uniref:Uncharacterized protein n=1 Tax=Halopseudomonas salegens TaxID=1434072 RepID=A0A1H2FFW4_9GAMM|nr:hypothetical protein [Halopseudomonas salegens]SDU06251.1 hypothetical protein SAMN05216210_1529 [Halopseudomonas salegens]